MSKYKIQYETQYEQNGGGIIKIQNREGKTESDISDNVLCIINNLIENDTMTININGSSRTITKLRGIYYKLDGEETLYTFIRDIISNNHANLNEFTVKCSFNATQLFGETVRQIYDFYVYLKQSDFNILSRSKHSSVYNIDIKIGPVIMQCKLTYVSELLYKIDELLYLDSPMIVASEESYFLYISDIVYVNVHMLSSTKVNSQTIIYNDSYISEANKTISYKPTYDKLKITTLINHNYRLITYILIMHYILMLDSLSKVENPSSDKYHGTNMILLISALHFCYTYIKKLIEKYPIIDTMNMSVSYLLRLMTTLKTSKTIAINSFIMPPFLYMINMDGIIDIVNYFKKTKTSTYTFESLFNEIFINADYDLETRISKIDSIQF